LTWLLPRLLEVGAGLVPPQQFIVIDTDLGIDDAVAVLTTLGDSSANVLAITCVRGNTDVPDVVVNTLKILTVAKKMQVR
jgi:purine nucleosidase